MTSMQKIIYFAEANIKSYFFQATDIPKYSNEQYDWGDSGLSRKLDNVNIFGKMVKEATGPTFS